MKRTVIFAVSCFLLFAGYVNTSLAQEKATKEECIAKCKAAVALFQQTGAEEALKQLNQKGSSFRWKDSYVFAFDDQEAKLMAHPAQRLLGWSMLEFVSADNVAIFSEILKNLETADQGWISYHHQVSQDQPVVQKVTYYVKVPGENIVVAAGYHEAAKAVQSQKAASADATPGCKIEEFAKSEGIMHGIAFDGRGHMFVGKNGKEILKVLPDGTISVFTTIEEAEGYFIEGPGHTFLYDMEFDKQGMLYAAVEDRILKISQDGKITALVEKKFSGNWGACGIALGQKKDVFYAYDNKIMKLTPQGKNELFLDGSQTSPPLQAIVGIDFSPDFQNLYACDGKLGSGKLVKIAVQPNGQAGPIDLLYHDKKINVEYIAFDKRSNLIIKGPWSKSFIRLQKNGTVEALKHSKIGFGIQTISMGGKGFDENALYGTHMPGGVIYKIQLPTI